MNDQLLTAAVDFENNESNNQTSTVNDPNMCAEQLTTTGPHSVGLKAAQKSYLLHPEEMLGEVSVEVKRRRISSIKSDEPTTNSALSKLSLMPLNVVLEILRQLSPSCLIKLSRINKGFRRILLNRSISLSVWNDSLSQVERLPKIPPGMSGIAWAHLLFSEYCYYCAILTESHPYWIFRKRICNRCSRKELVSPHGHNNGKNLRQTYQDDEDFQALDNDIRNSIIPTQITNRNKLRCLESDYDAVKAEYTQLDTPEQRQTYIQQRQRLVQEMQNHAQACVAWENVQMHLREDELRPLRERKKAAIIKKLEDLGWGTELQNILPEDSLYKQRDFTRSQVLTDKIWGHIQPRVVRYMEEIKAKRLEREYQALKLKRKGVVVDCVRAFKQSHHPGRQYFPEPLDYCTIPRIQETVDLPVDVEVDARSFTGIVNDLPNLFADWIEGVDHKIGEVVRDVLNQEEVSIEEQVVSHRIPGAELTVEGGVKRLKLATTVLVCLECKPPGEDRDWLVVDSIPTPPSRPLFYPQVLGHSPCFTRDTKLQLWAGCADSEDSDPCRYLGSKYVRLPWDCSSLTYNEQLSKNAEIVVKAAGIDPATATSNDMDQLNIRLVCQKCLDNKRTKYVRDGEAGEAEHWPIEVGLFEWRAMTRHLTDHFHDDIKEVIVLNKVNVNELSDEVIAAENALRLKLVPQWSCMHCIDTPREKIPRLFAKLKDHFSLVHQKMDSLVLNEDYFEHFSAPNIRTYHRPLWVHWKNGSISPIPCQINIGEGDVPGDYGSYHRGSYFPTRAEIDYYDVLKDIPTDYGNFDNDDDDRDEEW